MEGNIDTYETIDEYISNFSPEIQEKLIKLRKAIREAAPDAREKIGYRMPTFTLDGKNLVHFAAFDNHIGFYPTPSGIETFKQELSAYKGAKGSVQFPIDMPIPYELVSRIVRFRVDEVMKQKKYKSKK